uniref:Uncharacterized protein n=1 Tax=Terrapene triunguis TaxID=2587831 RepID=A0A674JZZ5_9SAUR
PGQRPLLLKGGKGASGRYSATCTRRSGLCSRGSARRSAPSVATVDLVAEKSFQVRRRSW